LNVTYFIAGAISLVIIAVLAIYGIPIGSPLAVLRLLIGIPVLTFFPGYLLVRSVFSNRKDFIEQIALSVSFSLGLVSLIGTSQYFIAGKIELLRTLLLFTALTIICIFVSCKVSKSSSPGIAMYGKSERRKIFLVYFAFIVITSMHIFQIFQVINQSTCLAGSDYANWLAHAYTFKTGSLFIFWNEDSGYPPLSISLIAIMSYLFGDELLALKFLILLTSSLFIFVSYILGKALTGSYLTGLVASLISASFRLSLNTIAWGGYPTLLSYIYCGLTAFFLLRMLERQNTTLSNIIGAGLNIGFLILTHHVSFFTFAMILLSFFILSLILGSTNRKELTKAYVSIGLIGLAIASPYVYHILVANTHLSHYLQNRAAYFHHVERVQFQNLFQFITNEYFLTSIFSAFILIMVRKNVIKEKIFFLLVWLLIPLLLTRLYLIGFITDYLRFFYFIAQPVILLNSVAYYSLYNALVKAVNKVESNHRMSLPSTTHSLKIASCIILLMLMSTLIVTAFSNSYSSFKNDYNWFLSIRQNEYDAITWLKNHSSPLDVVVAPHELALWTRGLSHVRVLEDTPEEYVFYDVQLDRIRASSLILHSDYEIRNGLIRMRLQESKGWLFNPLVEVVDYDPTVSSYSYIPLLYLQDYWTNIVLSNGKSIRLDSFPQSYVKWVMKERERASLQQVFSYGKSNDVRNLITNSGFENGTWGGKEVLESSYVWEGRHSSKLVASYGYVASGLSNAIPAKILAGETFTVSAMVDAQVSKGSLYLRIHYYDANNRIITHWDWAVINNSTNGWRLFSTTFTPDHPFHPSNVNGTDHVYFDFAWWDPTNSTSGSAFVDDYKCELGLIVTKTLTVTKFEPTLRVDINVTPSEAVKEVVIGGFSFYNYRFSRYAQQGSILTLIGQRNASIIMSSNFIESLILLDHPEYHQTFFSLNFKGSNASITLRLYSKGWAEDIYTVDINEVLKKYQVSYVMIYNHTGYWLTLRFLNRVDLFSLVYWNNDILIFKVKER